MKLLILEQTNKEGHKKSWRLTPAESPAVLGSSRLAQIISQDSLATPFEGVFEFQKDKWYFYDMHPDRINNSLSCEINQEVILEFQSSKLKITCIEKKEKLSETLESRLSSGEFETGAQGRINTKPFQIFLVKHSDRLIETKVVKLNKNAEFPLLPGKPKIKSISSRDWIKQDFGNYSIHHKTIFINPESHLAQLTVNDLLDSDGRKSAAAVFISTFLVGILAYLAPVNKTEYAAPITPKTPQKIIVKNEPPRKKKEVTPEKGKANLTVTDPARTPASLPPSQTPTPTPEAKVAHLVKDLRQGRISTLLGKISAQAAKSKNVIISSGKAAGQGPSGPALSALGSADKPGRDWSTDAKGAGVTINTAGKGGGNNLNGFGTLSGGKVGNGGVGLIEDESEIVGGLDREIIAQYIKTQLGQILYCYERQLAAQPDLFGKVAVRFEINGDGSVGIKKIGDSTLKNATVEGCILNKVAAWKFPAPQGGTKVMVTYPFLFKSTN